MWNVDPNRNKNRDENYGPEYGIDYARFADPPDLKKDALLKALVDEKIPDTISPTVRNGFVILKGKVLNDEDRNKIIESVRNIPGVVEVINQMTLDDVLKH